MFLSSITNYGSWRFHLLNKGLGTLPGACPGKCLKNLLFHNVTTKVSLHLFYFLSQTLQFGYYHQDLLGWKVSHLMFVYMCHWEGYLYVYAWDETEKLQGKSCQIILWLAITIKSQTWITMIIILQWNLQRGGIL